MTASLYICFEPAADLGQDDWKYGIQGLLAAKSGHSAGMKNPAHGRVFRLHSCVYLMS